MRQGDRQQDGAALARTGDRERDFNRRGGDRRGAMRDDDQEERGRGRGRGGRRGGRDDDQVCLYISLNTFI